MERPQGVAQAPAHPTQTINVPTNLSESDQVWAHLHLAYLYVLEACRILVTASWGADGIENTEDDLFTIQQTSNGYEFALTPAGQTRFDEITSNPASTSKDLLREFRVNERQAILDSLFLLIGAEVKVIACPDVPDIDGEPILEQVPRINEIRQFCQHDALFHFQDALDLSRTLGSDLAESFDELNANLANDFARDLLDQVVGWGFVLENRPTVQSRLNQLFQTP